MSSKQNPYAYKNSVKRETSNDWNDWDGSRNKSSNKRAKTMEQLAKYQQNEGIFTKPYVIENAKTLAPATWWGQYGKHLPLLSSVACKVLAQTVCA